MAPTMPAKFLPKFPQSQGGARNPPMGSESGLSWSSFHLYCFLSTAENLLPAEIQLCKSSLKHSKSMWSRLPRIDPMSAWFIIHLFNHRILYVKTSTRTRIGILDPKTTFQHQFLVVQYKVNRCLARYSLRATIANQPTNRALFTGEIKSFVTHITENPPRHLVHRVFWSGIGQNVQKMAIFGPK